MTRPLLTEPGFRSDVWRAPEGSCWPSDHERFDNGRGPMAPGGKAHCPTGGLTNCTPAARALSLARDAVDLLRAINRKAGR